MLAEKFTTDTPLPQPGSFGYLRGTAQRARVIRRNGEGRCLVQLFHKPRGFGTWEPVPGSSGNTEVPEADLYATERDASFAGRAPKGRVRKPRQPRAK